MICTTCSGACKEGGTAWVWLDMLNLVIYHGDRKASTQHGTYQPNGVICYVCLQGRSKTHVKCEQTHKEDIYTLYYI